MVTKTYASVHRCGKDQSREPLSQSIKYSQSWPREPQNCHTIHHSAMGGSTKGKHIIQRLGGINPPRTSVSTKLPSRLLLRWVWTLRPIWHSRSQRCDQSTVGKVRRPPRFTVSLHRWAGRNISGLGLGFRQNQ